jgi:protein-L-isoaspartate(D-aspartate) O-methyltransferase
MLAAHIEDARVLDAIESVPRHLFVPRRLRERAWADVALPIGRGQTISQPTVVARMCELLDLDGSETVLDVGTGSGYHAAVLARLVRRVVSVERVPELSRRAQAALASAGETGVELVVGDGSLGLPDRAPFDAISVAAAADEVPPALEEQLAPGGRLVVPVDMGIQRLVLVRREVDGALRRSVEQPVRFVPLVS